MRIKTQTIAFKISFKLIIGVGLLLAGCGMGQEIVEDIPPKEIIELSLKRFNEMSGFEFLVERTGEPAFIDVDNSISFRRAEGIFVYPDKVETTVRVIAPGVVTELGIIVIGDDQWETNLLTGKWQSPDLVYGFNPATLFEPETGIQSIIASDLQQVELLGMEELEELPGLDLYAITGVIEGARVYDVTYGMIDKDILDVKIWIQPGSYELHKIVLIDPADEGEDEDTVWEIEFWNFDKEFQILPPPVGEVIG